jgi:hypothetical protein
MRLRWREARLGAIGKSLEFPWVLSSQSSLFNGLKGKFSGIVFEGVRRGDVRLAAGGREIVGEAVDLVEQTLPFLRPVSMFRHDGFLVLVEPIDHFDERRDRLELAASDRLACGAACAGAPVMLPERVSMASQHIGEFS